MNAESKLEGPETAAEYLLRVYKERENGFVRVHGMSSAEWVSRKLDEVFAKHGLHWVEEQGWVPFSQQK